MALELSQNEHDESKRSSLSQEEADYKLALELSQSEYHSPSISLDNSPTSKHQIELKHKSPKSNQDIDNDYKLAMKLQEQFKKEEHSNVNHNKQEDKQKTTGKQMYYFNYLRHVEDIKTANRGAVKLHDLFEV